jgi:hypothetical protein
VPCQIVVCSAGCIQGYKQSPPFAIGNKRRLSDICPQKITARLILNVPPTRRFREHILRVTDFLANEHPRAFPRILTYDRADRRVSSMRTKRQSPHRIYQVRCGRLSEAIGSRYIQSPSVSHCKYEGEACSLLDHGPLAPSQSHTRLVNAKFFVKDDFT